MASLTPTELKFSNPVSVKAATAKMTTQATESLGAHVAATKEIEGLRKKNDVEETKAQVARAKEYATGVANRKTDINVTATAAPSMQEITPTSVESIPELGADEMLDEMMEQQIQEEAEELQQQIDLMEKYQALQTGKLGAVESLEIEQELMEDALNNENSEFEVIYSVTGKPLAVVKKPRTEMDMWKNIGSLACDAFEYGAGMVTAPFGAAFRAKGAAIAAAGDQVAGQYSEAGEKWADIWNAEGPVDLVGKIITAGSATVALGMGAIDYVLTALDPTPLTDAFKELGLELPIDTGIFTQPMEEVVMKAIEDPSSLAQIGDVFQKAGGQMLTKMTGGLAKSAGTLMSKTTGALTKNVQNGLMSRVSAGMGMTKMNSALSASVMKYSNGLAKRMAQKVTTKCTENYVKAIRSKVASLPCCGKGANPIMNTIVNQFTLASVRTTRDTTDHVRRNNLNSMINVASMSVNYSNVTAQRQQALARYNRSVVTRDQILSKVATSSIL